MAQEVVVCLGRTAAQSLIGGHVSMERQRGRFFSGPFAPRILLTYHLSSILRAADHRTRDRLFGHLVKDLQKQELLKGRFRTRRMSPGGPIKE